MPKIIEKRFIEEFKNLKVFLLTFFRHYEPDLKNWYLGLANS